MTLANGHFWIPSIFAARDTFLRHAGLQKIDQRLKKIGKGKALGDRIDERGKLTNQVFGSDGHLMVVGAGGKYICAASIPLEQAANLVVDQTSLLAGHREP